MSNQTFLENLKAEDEVLVKTGVYGIELTKVERTTSTLIIVNNKKFRRSTGRLIGDNLPYTYLSQPTDLEKQAISRKRNFEIMQAAIKNAALTNDQLSRIVAIIEESSNDCQNQSNLERQ